MNRLPIAITLAASLGACAGGEPSDPSRADLADPGRPLVIAHRGFSARAPEHTFAAWDLARLAGADYLEQDLQMTSDGVLVVLHDPTLDRTARGPVADCTGLVSEKTLAQLRGCDFGAWFNEARPDRARPEYLGVRLPTLADVLERYGTSVRYYIETKNPDEAPGMEDELIRLLREHGLIALDGSPPPVLVQSFSPESLRKIHRLVPELPLVQLFGRVPAAQVRDSLTAVSEYAFGIGPHFTSVDSTVVAAAHAIGLVVHPYTVDDSTDIRRMLGLGIDGFFTNEAEAALRVTRAF